MFTRHFTVRRSVEPSASPASEDASRLRAEVEARDATISELEAAVAAAQAQTAALQHALEQADFKTRVLEQSYATQLAEARARAAAAERLDRQQRARIAELEGSHAALTKQLAEARPPRSASGPDAVSIDELLASFAAPRARPLSYDADTAPSAPADAQAAEELLPAQVMLARKQTTEER